MSLRTSGRAVSVVAAAVGLLAASCGGDNKSSSSPSSAAAAGGAVTTAGPTGGATPGVTADSVTVGIVAGTSGPFGDALKEPLAGLDVWLKEINAAGGINGRQVKLKSYDHKETTDGAVAACKQILADNDVLFSYDAQGAGAHLTVGNCLDQAGFTNFLWQTDEQFGPTWKHTYGLFAGNQRAGEVTGEYVASQVKPGDKVALAVGNASIYKTTGDAMKAALEKKGVAIVDTESIELTGTTFVPQLQHMKDAGATVVALATVQVEATMLKEAKSIGFNPRWTGTGYVYDFLPNGNPGIYDNVTGLALSRTKDSPEYAQFRTVADKFGIKCETGCAQQFLFYGYGKVIQAALEAAGKNPTRESLAAGIKTIKDYPTLATAPISYSDTNFIGTDQMFPAKCCAPDNTWIGTGPAANKF